MQIYGISEKEMTPAELFEDFHRRMAVRNRISNALVAISLYEAKSESRNLARYIVDGLSISEECVSILSDIAQGYESYRYRSYISKVLVDILTDRLYKKVPDKSKLERYKERFSAAKEIFKAMDMGGELDPDGVRTAEQVMKDIDKEIESTYAGEENLYRGSFVAR